MALVLVALVAACGPRPVPATTTPPAPQPSAAPAPQPPPDAQAPTPSPAPTDSAAGQVPEPVASHEAYDAEDAARQARGEQALSASCTICHGLETVTGMRRGLADWRNVVEDMVSRGAPATGEQPALIHQYLARNFGMVNVNTCSADELAVVTGLSPQHAAAVIAYRQANGRFADAAALARVPGIDQSRLEDDPDALLFN